jgi:hypothetical protein
VSVVRRQCAQVATCDRPYSLPSPVKSGWSLTSRGKLTTRGVRAFSGAYRRGDRGSSASSFRQRPTFVNKSIIILSEDVKQEKARTFVGRIADGTAVFSIRDLREGRVCPCSVQSVSCMTRWSSMLSRLSQDVIYFYGSDVDSTSWGAKPGRPDLDEVLHCPMPDGSSQPSVGTAEIAGGH